MSTDQRLESKAAKATILGTIIAAVALVIAMIQFALPNGLSGGQEAHSERTRAYESPTTTLSSPPASSSTPSPKPATPTDPSWSGPPALITDEGSITAEPHETPHLDPCLVGRWQVQSHQELVQLSPQVSVLIRGPGPVVLITPDGQETDMWPPTGATIAGSNLGHSVAITVWGSIVSSVATNNGVYSFVPTQIDVRSATYVDNIYQGDLFKPVRGEGSYTCDSSQVVFEGKSHLKVVMSRL